MAGVAVGLTSGGARRSSPVPAAATGGKPSDVIRRGRADRGELALDRLRPERDAARPLRQATRGPADRLALGVARLRLGGGAASPFFASGLVLAGFLAGVVMAWFLRRCGGSHSGPDVCCPFVLGSRDGGVWVVWGVSFPPYARVRSRKKDVWTCASARAAAETNPPNPANPQSGLRRAPHWRHWRVLLEARTCCRASGRSSSRGGSQIPASSICDWA